MDTKVRPFGVWNTAHLRLRQPKNLQSETAFEPESDFSWRDVSAFEKSLCGISEKIFALFHSAFAGDFDSKALSSSANDSLSLSFLERVPSSRGAG